MAELTEGRHAAAFVLSEANRSRSRAAVTVASGAGVVAPGTVLGKITASGKYVPVAAGAVDGSEVASAIALYEADAQAADVEIAAIVRDAEVNVNELLYGAATDTQPERDAAHGQLANVGIIVR